MILIRFANIADAELIAEMSRQTFYETFAIHNSKEDMDKFMSEQFTSENLIKEVETGNGTFLLAFDGENPVGYVRMREEEKRPELGDVSAIEVARIYAVRSAIGKGVGRALMEKCIEIATTQNKSVIWLGVWEKNERAIRFYEQWGFQKFAEHDFLLGNDRQTDWLMKKDLQPCE